jgi:plasmid stabilization system protein ParE
MRPVQHSVRLPIALDKQLRALAEQQGVTVYAMLQRAVKAGLVALAHPPESGTTDREIVTELASVSTRMVDVERLLDRALFTACASYCYARSAALGGGKTDDDITAETNEAYDRQRGLSQEGRS